MGIECLPLHFFLPLLNLQAQRIRCLCCEQNKANKLALNTDLLSSRRGALALPNAVWWRHTQQFGGLMDQYHTPDESQVAKLLAADAQAPVAALNLFWFAERAHYQPEDPEYGTAAGDVSGREVYAVYAAEAGPAITQLGGHVAFSVAVDQVMIGPQSMHCDTAAIMVFPTRAAFIEMLSAPQFQAASRHRKAALANHIMLHLDGTPFTSTS